MFSLLVVLVTIVLVSNVSAIGITPGKRTFDFHPQMDEEVEFRVVNTEYKEMTVHLYKEGELAEFIEFAILIDVDCFHCQ